MAVFFRFRSSARIKLSHDLKKDGLVEEHEKKSIFIESQQYL